MKGGLNIGVVIPALNEEQAIGRVIADIPDWVDRIVVVDNGSEDRTADIARAEGAEVIRELHPGYGAACQSGIAELRNMEIIVFLDGDYSDYPEEMRALVAPIISGDCQFVLGSRVRGTAERGALTPQQRFGNWLACSLIRIIWGTQYTDLGPFRAISTDALSQLRMGDRGYGWTIEMQIKAVIAGLSIVEVPVRYRRRIGISKISGTLKGTLLAGAKILCVIGRFALSSAFLPAAARK